MDIKKYFFIEGNVGSGKTFVIELLRLYLKSYNIIFKEEPVSKWRKVGIFGEYYKNPSRWGLSFQMYILMSKLSRLKQTSGLTLMERSGFSDYYVFVKQMYKDKILTKMELVMYEEVFHTLMNAFEINKNAKYIYIRTDPETCLERIKKRDRKEERDCIPIELLKKWHKNHEENLIPYLKKIGKNILIIDNNKEFLEVDKDKLIKRIEKFIKK
jgi:deoxyadenosine/deoxycytidine kinase